MVDVLIVDDSVVIRRMITRILRETELPIQDVFEAGDGIEALAALKQHGVGLVLSDINMPNMDGLELLGMIRRNPDWKQVHVVMITTEGAERKVLEAIRLGASGYVRKPFTPEQIKTKLTPLMA
ncbi:MAG: response regulator [Bryobacterales bacterium]|nr:response regulator [Bryobacterales bacterium]